MKLLKLFSVLAVFVLAASCWGPSADVLPNYRVPSANTEPIVFPMDKEYVTSIGDSSVGVRATAIVVKKGDDYVSRYEFRCTGGEVIFGWRVLDLVMSHSYGQPYLWTLKPNQDRIVEVRSKDRPVAHQSDICIYRANKDDVSHLMPGVKIYYGTGRFQVSREHPWNDLLFPASTSSMTPLPLSILGENK